MCKNWLVSIGLSLDIIGVIWLYFGSLRKPWDIQTHNGDTPKEKAWERKMGIRSKVGLFLIGIGFFLQLLANILYC